jgi:uncharacterized protein YdeI (YjbR/CyaY-like superfamily)
LNERLQKVKKEEKTREHKIEKFVIKTMNSLLYLTNRKDWRRWLAKNHQKKKEVWLIYYKRNSGKPLLSYDASVEEAPCYGWIDSRAKSINEQKFALRFTPRTKNSCWSKYNMARASKMIQQRKMTSAGMALLPLDTQ